MRVGGGGGFTGGAPQGVDLYASSDPYSSPLHNQTTCPQGGGPSGV